MADDRARGNAAEEDPWLPERDAGDVGGEERAGSHGCVLRGPAEGAEEISCGRSLDVEANPEAPRNCRNCGNGACSREVHVVLVNGGHPGEEEGRDGTDSSISQKRREWNIIRVHQRWCAVGSILIMVFLSSLTSLEFVLPGLDVELPPPLCYKVADRILIKANFTSIQWEGWGTSLAWWANWAGTLPEANRTLLLDEIFDKEKGLGLTVARYNIGGGGKSEKDLRFKSAPTSYRATPGFKYTPTSHYNWSQDLPQRAILLGARGRGVNLLEAFAYSPPAWMTISGDVAGAFTYKADNLDKSNYAAYASYILDVVVAYKEKWGIEFQTLSPVNEPVEGWWVEGGLQEGCNFAPSSLNRFLPYVQQAIEDRQVKIVLSAFDSWMSNVPDAISKFDTVAQQVIKRLNVHTYQPIDGLSYTSSLNYRENMAKAALSLGKRVVVSEWGPLYLEGSDLDIALVLGRTITLDVNVMGVWGWSYWQAVEDFAGEPYWGLIYADFSNPQPFNRVLRKQYFVLKQFSRWVTPGSVPIHVDSSCAAGLLAVYGKKEQRLVLVVTNEGTGEATRTFILDGFVAVNATASVDIYRTSQNEDHSYAAFIKELVVPGPLTRIVLGKSVTTYIINGVKVKGAKST